MAVSLYANNPTDVLFDINGTSHRGAGFAVLSVTPCRVADTRPGRILRSVWSIVVGCYGRTIFPDPGEHLRDSASAGAYSFNFTWCRPAIGVVDHLADG